MLAIYGLMPNPPRRKKRKTKKTAAKKKTPMAKRRRKKKTRSRKTRARRKAPRRKRRASNPKPRRRRRLRTTARTAAPRRRRRRATRKRRNPCNYNRKRSRRRTSRRRRSNPGYGRGTVGGFMRRLQKLWSMDTITSSLQATVGFSAALMGPDQIARLIRQPAWSRGIPGVILSGVSAAAAATLAGILGFKRASQKIMVGGLVATALRALIQILPARIVARYLPLQRLQQRALPAPVGAGAGMGLISAEQLISPQLGMHNNGYANGYSNGGQVGSYLQVQPSFQLGSYMSAGEPVPNIQTVTEQFQQSNVHQYTEGF